MYETYMEVGGLSEAMWLGKSPFPHDNTPSSVGYLTLLVIHCCSHHGSQQWRQMLVVALGKLQ